MTSRAAAAPSGVHTSRAAAAPSGVHVGPTQMGTRPVAARHEGGVHGACRARRPPNFFPIWGGEGEDDVAWWDPRIGKENRETVVPNCILGMKTFLLHPNNLYRGSNLLHLIELL
jgi:hypothetical protein